jgi:hypothetical protein
MLRLCFIEPIAPTSNAMALNARQLTLVCAGAVWGMLLAEPWPNMGGPSVTASMSRRKWRQVSKRDKSILTALRLRQTRTRLPAEAVTFLSFVVIICLSCSATRKDKNLHDFCPYKNLHDFCPF